MSDSSQPIPISKHRLQEARRLGYTPRSSELTSGVVLLTAAWIGHMCLPPLCLAIQELVASGFQLSDLTPRDAVSEFSPAAVRVGREILRIGAACWAAALVTDLAQVGLVWSPVSLLPHEERISPISGLARILSWPTFERASLLSMKLLMSLVALACFAELALRFVFASADDADRGMPFLWGMGTNWTCYALACVGASCLVSGIVDAWVRQRRWRLTVEQTEDERRRGE